MIHMFNQETWHYKSAHDTDIFWLKQSAHNDCANKYFWDHEVSKIAMAASDESFAEKKLEIMKKITAVTALHSYNQDSLSTSNHSLQQDVSSSSSMDDLSNDNTDRNHSIKRKHQKDDASTTMQAKRPNKQETLAEKFKTYKQKIIHDAATELEFSLETNLPELIALNNVMLLKPSQFSRYMRDHFTDKALNEWHKGILSTLIVDVEKEAQDIAKSLDDIIYNLQKKKIKTREAVQKLVAMSIGKEDHEAQILIGLSNLIQKLPSQNLLSTTAVSKTELWSSVFDPILTALFSNPDRNTLLRW
ncbi:uncharacterized protein BX663DRAFT_269891 [Cokeromyces recurvatus]|uniref:uncharacterized protein n=1 Tax=Cokeromyces recurvatus TaxID=90255 RepID=UPI00221E4CD0|nr:uncharacterized protein BX663DRAFT_269891 [Cokeromyces recurvatus]KAI7898192.1 hypothetical protein BX663DRAFT_269891 [Cokeromyces recurvatus]